MRKWVVGMIVGAMLVTSMVWAAGGQRRYGQTGTQPRTRSMQGAGAGQCLGSGLSQAQRRGQTMNRFNGQGKGQSSSQGKQLRQRKRDGSCLLGSVGTSLSKGDGSTQIVRKQTRDRKKDGTC